MSKLYDVETKQINRQVKRNIERFDEDFCFQLTNNEYKNLKCQIGTSSLKEYGGRRTLPYVFTEQGVAMLATILKTKVAVDTTIGIMDAFISMRHYIGNNLSRLSNLEVKVIEHDNNIRLLQESFQKLEANKEVNEIYFDGKVYDETYHDRYFIIDRKKIYHSGNSVNHIGYRKSSLNILKDEKLKRLLLEI